VPIDEWLNRFLFHPSWSAASSLLFFFSLALHQRKREDEDEAVPIDEWLNRFLFNPSWSAASSLLFFFSLVLHKRKREDEDEAVPINEQLNRFLFHPSFSSAHQQRKREDGDGAMLIDKYPNRFLFHPSWSTTFSPSFHSTIRRRKRPVCVVNILILSSFDHRKTDDACSRRRHSHPLFIRPHEDG